MTPPKTEPYVVVAVFRARPGSAAALQAELIAMLGPTRLEDGCLRYDLHRATDATDTFFFCEIWSSADAHRRHLTTAHVGRILAVSPDLLAEPIREFKGELIPE